MGGTSQKAVTEELAEAWAAFKAVADDYRQAAAAVARRRGDLNRRTLLRGPLSKEKAERMLDGLILRADFAESAVSQAEEAWVDVYARACGVDASHAAAAGRLFWGRLMERR